MTYIRVDVEQLRMKADELEASAERIRALGNQLMAAARSAPSYDGQFRPKVIGLAQEGRAELDNRAQELTARSADLRMRADAFEQVDRQWEEALAGISWQGPFTPTDVQGAIPGQKPPWWLVELIIGLVPFGDCYDIGKELIRLITSGEADTLILILAALGLLADIGWADGPVPDPVDGANAGLALLKGLVKQIPPGPARVAIQDALLHLVKNADEAPEFFAALQQVVKHEEVFEALKANPAALSALLTAGPEAMQLLAKNEDLALQLIKRGDDAAAILKNADALEVVTRHGPESIAAVVKAVGAGEEAIRATDAALQLRKIGPGAPGAQELIQQITDLSAHGAGDRVVLGKWVEGGGYIEEAVENGGKYYESLPGVWDALGKNADLAWETNERFLRNQLEGGVPRIEVVGETIEYIEKHAIGTARWKEIQYLREVAEDYGYKLIGNAWVKP
jgi:hypothetical protein